MSEQSLKTHFLNNRNTVKNNWTYIFNKFDNLKFSLIELATKELQPLLEHFCPDFNIQNKTDNKKMLGKTTTKINFKGFNVKY